MSKSKGYYGIVVWLISVLSYISYTIWLLVPDRILHDTFGLNFLPSKYWALVLPIYLVILAAAVPILYTLYCYSDYEDTYEENYKLSKIKSAKTIDLLSDTPEIYDINPANVKLRLQKQKQE
eukprot:snap_masked-scaffold_4-processed-gene-9.1-mRNA-1 protein AED:1.00 eAED:1.00 QI:0/-1/0/0/-1/1/1/0/121